MVKLCVKIDHTNCCQGKSQDPQGSPQTKIPSSNGEGARPGHLL